MSVAPLRIFEAHARLYRKNWRASVFSSFLNPVLFLVAMGVSLGTLVDDGGALGVPYLTFLAPGLLAATAMQTGFGEAAWPVMAGFKWRRSYHVAVTTPLEPIDVLLGTLAWAALRVLAVVTAYALVISAFGAVDLGASLLSIWPAALTGVAFVAPVMAYTARLERDTSLSSLMRFGVVPLFLFSGTFFPITQLPAVVQPLAYVTPLWHGVELTRAVATGTVTTFDPVVHVAVLMAFVAVGVALAAPAFKKKLLV